jgi:hypothetical protein
MSTRAVYTFKDEYGEHHVYKHCDGYPMAAAEAISKTLPFAWPLPRFEADEFAAAFIQANKQSPGGVRLTHGPQCHGDLAFEYVIAFDGKSLRVDFKDFSGTLQEMLERFPAHAPAQLTSR